jgi:uncharacterized protein YkwD
MAINLFDANYYRAVNADLRGLNDDQAWLHFQNYGLNEGRGFSAFVDLNLYRGSNNDLAGYNYRQAYEHLSNYGVREGRKFSQYFDSAFYRNSNSDLASFSNEQLFDHLQRNGIGEGREFSQFFNVNYYIAENPDVAKAYQGNKLNALIHFQSYGLNEGRRFSLAFDTNYYRQNNPDLIAARLSNQDLFQHFQNYGLNEGRNSSEEFNIGFYLGNSSDLRAAGFNYRQAYEHFLTYGLREGRNASPFISHDHSGNSLNEAHRIDINSNSSIFRESVNASDSSDFYGFSLDAASNSLNLTINGLSSNTDFELLNNAGQVLARSTNPGITNEAINIDNLQAGNYFIRVYSVDGGNSNYNLSLLARTAAVSSEISQNSPNASTASSPVPQSISNTFVNEVLNLTNTQRTQRGLQPLQLNQRLTNAAQGHSEDMALRDYFSHEGPNGSSIASRVIAAGYNYSRVGENIAAGYATAQEVVNSWMNSPGHKANILNPDFQEIGIGYYYLANDVGEINYQQYWTQDFGKM